MVIIIIIIKTMLFISIRLPLGGFRSVVCQSNRSFTSQHTSIMTLPCETNNADQRCSTGTSTTSSKLSDARILREVTNYVSLRGMKESYAMFLCDLVTHKSVICKSKTTFRNRAWFKWSSIRSSNSTVNILSKT